MLGNVFYIQSHLHNVVQAYLDHHRRRRRRHHRQQKQQPDRRPREAFQR